MKYNLICCHDAGGANIIYNYFKNKKVKNIKYLIKGPAKKIFKNKKFIKISDINKFNFKKIYTGTSFRSNLEKRIIKYGIEKKIEVITFLDHYVNYKNRFKLKHRFFFPNQVWVHDRYSLKIAKQKLKIKNLKIYMKNNYYFKTFKLKKSNKNFFRIVFISEKILIKNLNMTKLALEKFFTTIGRFLKKNNNKKLEILINIHPNEKIKKYHFPKNNTKNFRIKISRNLRLSLRNTDIVVGIRSFALKISEELRIKTFTILPLKNLKSYLPFQLKKFSMKTLQNEYK